MKKKSSSGGHLQFSVQLTYEQQPQVAIDLVGFLFDCGGRLLQQRFADDNEFNFDLKEYKNHPTFDQLRLFVAPVTDKRILAVSNVDELENYKAYEPIMGSIADGQVAIQPIPEYLSQFWLYCKCRVKGKVSKWFDEGNVWENKAVCNARVHICEIDPIIYWIQRIPDHIIARIPEAILKPERLPRIPNPPIFNRSALSTVITAEENPFHTISVQEERAKITSELPKLSSEIKQNLATGNLNIIRNTIVNNYTLFHPWFCFWPWWWPYFYRCKELAVVKTNAAGNFDTTITYNCFGDKPDIYIWVEYFINGAWTTVYKPPIPCYTHWNYQCGSDINVTITDPRVPGDCCCNCGIGGEVVFVRTITEHTSVSHILQTNLSQPPPNQTVPYDRIGLTDASAGGDPTILVTTPDDYRRPFGGNPSFYIGFGNNLPNANITYYRWSYRKRADADLTPVADSYKPLIPKGGTMHKGYDFIFVDSNGNNQIGANSIKLGPVSATNNDNLYRIPPKDPSIAFGTNPDEIDPIWHEPIYNMNTLSFDSLTLEGGDGLYEFKLELFDKDGNKLNNIPRSVFKIPQHNNTGLSRNAPDIYLEDPTGNVIAGGTADAFNMLMRFDNQGCIGDIYTVNVNGTPASLDCCGFVNYKPDGVEATLELTFKAIELNNFAVFSFNVSKGTCGSVPIANASGMVIDSASGYTLNSGIYSKDFTPSQLLSECYDNGEGKAAFAQNLHIYTMATNGKNRVDRDFHKTAAFALEP